MKIIDRIRDLAEEGSLALSRALASYKPRGTKHHKDLQAVAMAIDKIAILICEPFVPSEESHKPQ
jgi:hypothetical protein